MSYMLLQGKAVATVPAQWQVSSPTGNLVSHLEELHHRNAISLTPQLVPGPPNAKLLEGLNLAEGCRFSPNMHAAVEVMYKLLHLAYQLLENCSVGCGCEQAFDRFGWGV